MRKVWHATVLAAVAVSIICPVLFAADEAEPAKKLFTDLKCSVCHSIESQGIEKKTKTSKAPDLSTVGSERTAEWIVKWVKKEEELKGKKHTAPFKGSDEDLKTVATWLETLKKK